MTAPNGDLPAATTDEPPGLGAWSDALDRLGIPGQLLGLAPVGDLRGVRIGRAFTLQYGAQSRGGGTVGDFIDEVGPDQMVVIANGGRRDVTVWGDILTQVAVARRVVGTVIDGVCRDVTTALDAGYPLVSRGVYMRTGKDRVQLDATQVQVTVAGVRVEPDDVIVAGREGALAIPHERFTDVQAVAIGIEAAEQRIRDDVAAGSGLAEARRRHGYMTLQASS